MYFKLIIPRIETFYFKMNYSLVFFFNDPFEITVILYASPNDNENIYEFKDMKCIAILSHQPSPKNLVVFQCLKDRKAPPGIPEEKCCGIDRDGNQYYNILFLKKYPQYFQSYLPNIYSELLKSARNVIESLRWRLNIKGKHNYYRSFMFTFSFDGINWLGLPEISDFQGKPHIERNIMHKKIENSLYQEFVSIINLDIGEPLAQELFREAWEQRFDNPRSALVIGIAAAETGFKQLIIDLEPGTEWIVKNLPSPPLQKMLVEYLPKLPVKCKINDQVICPPTIILDEIKKGIRIRNDIVHNGSLSRIRMDQVQNILLAIKDLLWLLNYYSGFEWAIEYIRPEIKDLLMKSSQKSL